MVQEARSYGRQLIKTRTTGSHKPCFLRKRDKRNKEIQNNNKKIIPITAGRPQHSGFQPKASSVATGKNIANQPPPSLWKGPTGTCSSLAYTVQDQKKTAISSALLNLESKPIKQPTCLHLSVFIHFWAFRHSVVLLEGLVAEEIVTQEAATELLQEAQDIPDAVHYQEAQEMLLPLKRC